MKAVGLTHGGFYALFADKTAMLTAANLPVRRPCGARIQRLRRCGAGQRSGPPTPAERAEIRETVMADLRSLAAVSRS
jgi:acyl-coenzyme A thioesterase PaaI-like protein